MKLPTLTASAVKNKTVLVRTDYNVPLKKSGSGWSVADDMRIKASLDTISFLLEHNAKVVLISHLGRPGGELNPDYSLKPVAKVLSDALGKPVAFVPDCIGDETHTQIEAAEPGSILLLENLRFHYDEAKNEAGFVKKLAKLADVYVNDAFSAAHREHASIVGVPKHLPSFAGKAFAKEVEMLGTLMHEPKRPFVMVIGGAKISDKVAAVEHLTTIADAVLVGGGVANNFLKADGFDVAKSYLQDTPADQKKRGIDYVDKAEELLADTKQERLLIDDYIPVPKILYPLDVIAAASPEKQSGRTIELVNGNHKHAQAEGLMYLDIGPKTIRLYREILLQAGTIFWNGPMGVFENATFADGTKEVARAIAKSGATTILGGGDTIAAIRKFELENRFDYVSAAGGASLEFLSGKMLPGIKALVD